ncbi:septin-7-like [Centruroides sculpturatus]|uniref:septin-7-like n=1 Tax=Centruroides sculpturatus TaxID=218467 RepID=UPI000C6CA2F6|nr:septin-7-like [Centruroides sculpturatus]
MQKGEFNYSSARRYVMSAKRELFRQQLSPDLLAHRKKNDAGAVSPTPKEMDTDSDYVGFSNLTNEIYRLSVRRGFHFTLMLVGEAGLGKSTFLNNLFLSNIYSDEYPSPSERIKPTVQIETTKLQLEENGVKLNLTVVDVPGFGDSLNNNGCWRPITNFINERFDQYLEDESRVNRDVIVPDNRVHCCLYFISPCGNGLRPLDVEVMKNLHDKVNIIPLIAKADSFTPEECAAFKKIIMNQIAHHNIKIYDFPSHVHGDNEALNNLKERLPYAIMGSMSLEDVSGTKKRGRKYPWGTAESEEFYILLFL